MILGYSKQHPVWHWMTWQVWIQYASIELLGQIIGSNGSTAYPNTKSEISTMMPPSGVHKLFIFMSMVNLLGKFVPNVSDSTEPLFSLIGFKNVWYWGEAPSNWYNHVKDMLTRYPNVALYHVKLNIILLIFSVSSCRGTLKYIEQLAPRIQHLQLTMCPIIVFVLNKWPKYISCG